MNIDDLDLEILSFLKKDARMANAAIGREVGLTGPAVYGRIRRLEEAGIIRGYRVVIDPEKMGRGLIGIVRVITRPTPSESIFEEFVNNEPRVIECFDVDGEDSFILKVRCASPTDLQDLLLRIRGLPVVMRTITNIVLKPVKQEL